MSKYSAVESSVVALDEVDEVYIRVLGASSLFFASLCVVAKKLSQSEAN